MRYMSKFKHKMEAIRKAHNLAKRTLIQQTTKSGFRVLDVGCGFGGDLQKWSHIGNIKVDMCDPSDEAIKEAKTRAAGLGMKHVRFYVGDISICPKFKYDIICYNFSMHYIFEKPKLFFQTLNEIRLRLKKGGKLIGCIPDSEKILMTTPFHDNLGNYVMRNKEQTGYGNFGEQIFVYLTDTPYYESGAIPEPIAYKDILITELEKIGIIMNKWEDLIPGTDFELTKIYSQFIFVHT
jgi:ubiquinone/menaquinone biosynthesis C-methylase UbiE